MNKQVILTVAQKSPPEVIHYVQMSNEIPIEFWLADYDITDTMECRLYIKKPSGTEVYNGAVNDGDHFTYYPTAQSFAESGRQMGQLQIVDGTGDDKKILMSFILLFDIEPNLVEESAIPSSNEFGVLDQLIDDARDAIQDAQNATNAANTAAGTANTAAGAANTAAGQATTAAGAANSAASAANSAKDAANTAAGAANSAAQAANSAAQAANDAAEKIEGLVDLDIPIQISKGGTEADNRVEAASNLLCLPNGTLPSADTTAEWAKLGNCIIYMNGTKENFNFPSTYGTLIQTLNYENSVTTVQQLWIKQATGQIYNRSGNSVGWNADADLVGSEAWEKIWTGRDTIPIINGGTGGATKQAAKENLAAACVLNSNRTNLSINASAVTIVPLNSFILKTDEGFTLNDYKLTLPYDGFVSVSGCAYVLSASGAVNYQPVGVFIDHHRGETLVREYSAYGAGVGGVAAPTVVIEVEAGDEISLLARSYSTAGEIVPNNPTTFLSATYV